MDSPKMISCREAAGLLGVTKRRIQQYCASGLVSGAVKNEGAWMIPAEALPAIKKNGSSEKYGTSCFPLFPLRVQGIPTDLNEAEKKLLAGEIAYLSGRAGEAIAILKPLSENTGSPRIAAASAHVICHSCMYTGNTVLWLRSRDILNRSAFEAFDKKTAELMCLAPELALYNLSKVPGWLADGHFDDLPGDVLPYAVLHFLEYHMITVSNPTKLFFLEPLISFAEAEHLGPISVYMRLILAIMYRNAGDMPSAERHIDKALDIAFAQHVYAPLLEFWTNAGGLFEKTCRERKPAVFKRLRMQLNELERGWQEIFAVCNRQADPSRGLSVKEAEIANYICMGLHNKEISEKMNISENTVRRYIQSIYEVMNVTNRAELKLLFPRGIRAGAKLPDMK